MVSLNTVQLTGNIVANPEIKTIGEGEDNVVVESRIVHNWSLPESSGSAKPHRRAVLPFKVYGKNARRFAETVTTKTNVLLIGHIETDEWKDGDQPRSFTYIRVLNFQYNSPRTSEEQTKPSSKQKPKG